MRVSIEIATEASYLIDGIMEVLHFFKVKTEIATRLEPSRKNIDKCKVRIMRRTERHNWITGYNTSASLNRLRITVFGFKFYH